MHYKALVTVQLPPISEDKETDSLILDKINELKQQSEADPNRIILNLHIQRLKSISNAFARAVDHEVSEIMEPYSQNTDDPRYLSFDDRTEELRDEYENGRIDCIKLPQGKIVEDMYGTFLDKYIIRNGQVFELNAGPLRHTIRTKKAKKMKVLLNYPRKKVYKSFKEYAEKERGYTWDEKMQGYGYWYNFDAMWDWYQIGGRWHTVFLVKKDCMEYSLGEYSWHDEREVDAPEGYMWVSAARKKDIAWDVMYDLRKKHIIETYHKLSHAMESGELNLDWHAKITEDGILQYGTLIFKKGETLDEFLLRCDIHDHLKYHLSVYDIVDEEVWLSQNQIPLNKDGSDNRLQWLEQIDDYIDDLDEDDVLVSVDYHM